MPEISSRFNLLTAPYRLQATRWPASGRHILAQYDDESIIIYQAYRSSIGRFAIEHGHFGGEFNLNRMSWIKPNFLWMMYRSGWGTKEGQEVVLAIRLKRVVFDYVLAEAVHSTFQSDVYPNQDEWKKALTRSSVRLQWDPDHDPSGAPLGRRAIQLGLRGDVLAKYAREWIIEIQDISPYVRAQRAYAIVQDYERLMTPAEAVYPVNDSNVARRLQVSSTLSEHAPVDAIQFYRVSDPFGCFSNFAAYPIALDGQVWPTAEHYFQAQKFVDTSYREQIRSSATPMEAARLGRDRTRGLRQDWDRIKDEVMYRVVLAKFTQHPDIKTMLLSAGNARLVEHTKSDSYWADGGDGCGKNMLGQILMHVRDELIG